MGFIGVEPRAVEAKRALNRLRWEVDYAIGQGRAADAAPAALAEAVGILTNVLEALAAALPEEPADELDAALGTARARFLQQVSFYTEYHKVGR